LVLTGFPSQVPADQHLGRPMAPPHNNPFPLPEQGLALLARVAGVPEGLGARRYTFMAGLAQILDAGAWFLVALPAHPKKRTRVQPWVRCHGMSVPVVLRWLEHWAPGLGKGRQGASGSGAGRRPTNTDAQGRPWWSVRHTRARTSQQLMDVARRSDHEEASPPFVCVALPETRGMRCVACFVRTQHGAAFAEHSCQVCESMLGQVAWLPPSAPPGDPIGVGLSPRQREVLRLLLAAKRRADIAAALHISEDTAKGHIGDVYRFFKVASQVELLAYFLSERPCCESSASRPCRAGGACGVACGQ